MKTTTLLTLVTSALLFTAACANPGRFGGGGQLQYESGELGAFSLQVQTIDVDKNGLIDEADRFIGHISLQPPKSARKTTNRINGNVVSGGVCSLESANNNLCLSILQNQGPGLPPVFGPLVQSTLGAIKQRPTTGYAVLAGFYRLSAKNPDTCVTADADCVPYVAAAVDTDQDQNFAPGDFVIFIDFNQNLLIAPVVKGNLSITSESTPIVP